MTTCDQVLHGERCGAPASHIYDPPNVPGIVRHLCIDHADRRFDGKRGLTLLPDDGGDR